MAWCPRRKCARKPHLERLKFIVERSSELRPGHDAVSLSDDDRETPQLPARLSLIALHHYDHQMVRSFNMCLATLVVQGSVYRHQIVAGFLQQKVKPVPALRLYVYEHTVSVTVDFGMRSVSRCEEGDCN